MVRPIVWFIVNDIIKIWSISTSGMKGQTLQLHHTSQGVSNHQQLFVQQLIQVNVSYKETPKQHITGPCEGNLLVNHYASMVIVKNLMVTNTTSRQISNIRHLSRELNCWSLRCSWSIACRRCSNYIFILDLTSGFKRFRKDSRKTVWESFKC